MDSSKMAQKRKEMKKNIMKQLYLLKPKPGCSTEQAIQSLVKQAQYYTNFLLSKHENKRIISASLKEKKRGHFDQQLSEERHLMEEEEEEQENQLTRLSEQPTILTGGKLKYYQLVGLNWMISLYESGLSGILADDMGLGKTIQTISMIGFLRQYKKIKGPHLIIAPKITLGNWKNQFQKWLPEAEVVKLIATKEQRTEILTNIVIPGKFDVIITSYQGVRLCLNNLTKIKWHYIVIDEAHKIKNEQSKLSQLIRKLNNQNKLLLTGTPLQNNLHQLWSLLNFLLPQIFDSSQMFDIWFDQKDEQLQKSQQQIEKKNVHMIQQLHKILRPFMLRRTKLQVQKTLPGKKQVHIFVGLTDTQLRVYKNILQTRSATQDQKKVYLNLLMQLRKVCNHPYLFEGVQEEGAPELGQHIIEASGKMIILDKLLNKLNSEGGHQVLIFSQMTMVMDILEDYCNYRKYKYCRIDGSTDMNSRDDQIDDFMNPETDKFIFLLSTRAGGLGINLTSADTVIIYDSDWNPQMDLQAMDRAHRIGQKNMVNVYRLITQDTIEQKIIQRQQIKLKWDNLVIQQAKTSSQKNKALTKQQIKQMLQYGASITLKAEKGTIRDEDINQILQRGQIKTKQMNKALQDKVKNQEKNLTDFSMNSINIFDFMMNDQKKKNQDQQAMDEVMARKMTDLESDIRTRREKLKNINYQNEGKKQFFKSDKRNSLPEHYFYENKDLLIQLLQKQEEYNYYKNSENPREPLTEQQNLLKQQLLETGFRNWNKTDFNSFVTASEKFGRNNLNQIAKFVGKDLEDVEQYHKVFWQRINQLSDKDKIIKQINTGEDKIANKKHNVLLLEWKASKCYEIDFTPQIYTKFKSKLFSIDADRFLAQCAYKYGIKNMTLIKQKIRTEPMFRYDHHFRSRSESQLNKRLQSLYKLIQKQKDHIQYGFDNEMLKQNKKKSKKNKQKQKKALNQEKQVQKNSNSDDESNMNKNHKSKGEKQTLLTHFNKNKPDHIQIQDSNDDIQ